MREVLASLLRWWEVGATVGMATVVDTWESAPRQTGATMLVGPDGSVVGSVSGGCVEAAVYELTQQVMATGVPTLQRYAVSGAEAYAVGLPCGGRIDVFVEAVSRTTFPELADVVEAVRGDRPVAVVTVVDHPDANRIGRRLVISPESDPASESGAYESGGVPELDRGSHTSQSVATLGLDPAESTLLADARRLLAAGQSRALTYGPAGEPSEQAMRVFVGSHAPAPRMLVFGATDVAASVARLGAFVGYRVTVCDARPLFATMDRFAGAAEVVNDWPHRYLTEQQRIGAIDERTVICVLTHDAKFDVPVLEVALRLPAVAFVGAMGSRRTHEDRLSHLRSVGLTATELARLSSPIGLDLGAHTPEETAVSVLAEIIGQRRGGGGRRLTELTGRIHHAPHPRPPNHVGESVVEK